MLQFVRILKAVTQGLPALVARLVHEFPGAEVRFKLTRVEFREIQLAEVTVAHQLLQASVNQHEMMLLRLVVLREAREPDNLPLWHRVIHPFFLNFVLLLNQNISFFDLVLINCLILLIWVLNFELDILNIFDEPNHLLSFDLHMVFKLVLMHQVLVSQAISVPGVRYG